MLILLQGDNLYRPDLSLQYHLSPAPGVTAMGHVLYVPAEVLRDREIAYLTEPKVSLLLPFKVVRQCDCCFG